MKNLNTKTVAEVASRLKIDAAKLMEHLQTDVADESKQETKVGEILNGTEVFTAAEKETLLFNHGKSTYDKGAFASREIIAKDVAKQYGLDPIDPANKDVLNLVKKIVEQEKTKLGTAPDKRVSDLETEKSALQKTVSSLTAEVDNWKIKVSETETKTLIRSSIQSALSNISIDAEEARLPAQRELLQLAYENKHEIKIEDGKQIVYRDGKKLVDNLQNPISIEQSMKDFAPMYVNLKQKTGRGDSSSSQSQLAGDLATITDKKTLAEYLQKKNIA